MFCTFRSYNLHLYHFSSKSYCMDSFSITAQIREVRAVNSNDRLILLLFFYCFYSNNLFKMTYMADTLHDVILIIKRIEQNIRMLFKYINKATLLIWSSFLQVYMRLRHLCFGSVSQFSTMKQSLGQSFRFLVTQLGDFFPPSY